MLPLFLNPAGFWALLGVPAIVAIHFLQQRLRAARTSTWFLIENLAPDSAHGRTWERLRPSRAFWFQLLAVLLAVWVLTQPRWVRSDSAQTVAIVLDSSASMTAFRDEAVRAVETRFAAGEGHAARMQWLLLSSDPRQPPLYRGADRAAALAALAGWRPALGTHDLQPALRLARTLAGPGGLTWLVTDRREQLAPDQPAVGVGRALPNVGFSGVTVVRDGPGHAWRALVQNHADEVQRRTWWIEAAGGRTPEQTLELAPGGIVEISGRFPDGLDQCLIVLGPDDFPADDRLPLRRPAPKPLIASVTLEGGAGEFFQRVLGAVEGVTFLPVPQPQLRVARTTADGPPPTEAAILLPPELPATAQVRVLRAPVVVEKNPLAADLNWQAWLGTGPGPLARAAGDHVLLWQDEQPLVWTAGAADEVRRLVLNFDWATSNAPRLPATVLMVRRHVEAVRDAQPGPYAANFDALSPVALAARDLASPDGLTLEFQAATDGAQPAARTLPPGEVAALRAPAEPGFFVLRRGDDVLVRGAAQFADMRESDFRAAESFVTRAPAEAAALLERNTLPDPFVPLWLGLIGACLLGSWWPGRRSA